MKAVSTLPAGKPNYDAGTPSNSHLGCRALLCCRRAACLGAPCPDYPDLIKLPEKWRRGHPFGWGGTDGESEAAHPSPQPLLPSAFSILRSPRWSLGRPHSCVAEGAVYNEEMRMFGRTSCYTRLRPGFCLFFLSLPHSGHSSPPLLSLLRCVRGTLHGCPMVPTFSSSNLG